MNLLPPGLLIYAGPEGARKKLRYVWVSLAFLPIGQGLLQVLGHWLDDYVVASLLAASIATLPNFFANKHLVWRVHSGRELHKQVLVFWLAVMLGVSLATVFTFFVEKSVTDQETVVRGGAVFCAQVVGFGTVWIGRFIVLDRWLFKGAGCTVERTQSTTSEDVPA